MIEYGSTTESIDLLIIRESLDRISWLREEFQRAQRSNWKQAGYNLRRIRKFAGLNLGDAAKLLGICKGYLGNMECGHKCPSLTYAMKLAAHVKKN